ncbi:MAG: helix-hairpin-helix domain-containing protein [Deltaproteobacteria bacterium]|nr:MAG: helix-hairpin-helix domain-containing protein [Deltaproteobacteria bacterium]
MTLSISNSISKLCRRLAPFAAIALLIAAMGGTWTRAASAAPPAQQAVTKPVVAPARPGDEPDEPPAKKSGKKQLTGKLNLNSANEDQLQLLPTVGPAKAERIVAWRAKNGGFKRVADLRRVKGFGYKTFKKLEPYLDIKGDTTLAAK